MAESAAGVGETEPWRGAPFLVMCSAHCLLTGHLSAPLRSVWQRAEQLESSASEFSGCRGRPQTQGKKKREMNEMIADAPSYCEESENQPRDTDRQGSQPGLAQVQGHSHTEVG